MKYLSGLLFIGFLLSACQSLTATPALSPVASELFPSPVPSPTAPSTELLPKATPTPLDFSHFAPITPANAADLKPVLGLTQSRINDFAWSPDGKFIVAASSHGLKLYSSDSLKKKPINLSPLLAQSSFVAFSPGGAKMVWNETSGSGEYGLWSLNLVDGKRTSIPIPNGELVGLSFNPAGQLIVGIRNGNGIQVWLAESEKLLTSFGRMSDAQGVVFSPNARLMVSIGHADLMAHVWNVDTGDEVGSIGKPNMYANSAAFSPTGNTLAIGYQGNVQLWDIAAWREIGYFTTTTDRPVKGLVFSPAGDLLAIPVAFERTMPIIDSSLKQIAEIESGWPEFSPNGKYLAVTNDSGLKLFDTSTWELRDSSPSPLGHVQQMVFWPNESILVSSHEDNTTVAWDLQTAIEISRISSPGKHFLSADGKFLAVGAGDGEVSVWDVVTGKMLKSYRQVSKWGVGDIKFSQDNHLLTFTYSDESGTRVAFWDLETEQEPKVFSLDNGLGYIDALTPDGHKLAVQLWKDTASTNVGVWDTQARKLIWVSKLGDAAWISSVALDPFAQILAVGDRWNGTISLYDTNSGKLLDVFNKQDRAPDYNIVVSNIVFSNNGKFMATIVKGGLALWDVQKRTSIDLERGCIREIESVAFSQDDTLFMIAGGENLSTKTKGGGVCIWDTKTGKLLAGLGGENFYTVKYAVFSPDGTMLAIADGSTIWIWGNFK